MSDGLLNNIDEIIHVKARLGIMSLLVTKGKSDFTFLKSKLGLTDGNLGSHIRILEEAGYIEVEKVFEQRKPKTLCEATEKGKTAFKSYVEELERIIKLSDT